MLAVLADGEAERKKKCDAIMSSSVPSKPLLKRPLQKKE
jgi:hypothetical protein